MKPERSKLPGMTARQVLAAVRQLSEQKSLVMVTVACDEDGGAAVPSVPMVRTWGNSLERK
jgi:hypothetical protein